MPRLMSVAYTEQAVIERRKTVTRRKGWWIDKNGKRLLHEGDRLTLCRKVMGRKKGEPLVRVAEVEVVDVRREVLGTLLWPGYWPHGEDAYDSDEMIREGFPCLDPAAFIWTYFEDAQGMDVYDDVTRIEWRYLDEED